MHALCSGPVCIRICWPCMYMLVHTLQQVVRIQIWQCLVRTAKACLQTNVLGCCSALQVESDDYLCIAGCTWGRPVCSVLSQVICNMQSTCNAGFQSTHTEVNSLPCQARAIHVAVIRHVCAACGRLHFAGLMMQQQVSGLTFVAEQVDLSSMSAWQQSYGAA